MSGAMGLLVAEGPSATNGLRTLDVVRMATSGLRTPEIVRMYYM